MKQRLIQHITGLSAAMLLGATLSGCTATRETETDVGLEDHHENVGLEVASDEDARDPRERDFASRYYDPDAGEGELVSAMAFPTGDMETSALLVHQVMPEMVRVNERFPFEYHVTNLTDSRLQNVSLTLDETRNLRVVQAEPSGLESDGMTRWMLGELGPGQTKVIDLTGSAQQVGTASDCISVSYNNFLCATTQVVQPDLALTKTATERALDCEEVVIRYTVENTGSGTASNVVIKDTLPEGMAMARGSRSVNIPVGNLAAGEAKAYEVRATVDEVGRYTSSAMATADGGLEAEAGPTETLIVSPELAINVDCPQTGYLGESFSYDFTVTNEGDGEARDATITATVPRGASVTELSQGGRVQGQTIVWERGNISPGGSADFSVTLNASEKATYQTRITADALCVEDEVTETCSTEIVGIPAILIEVIDDHDPVKVGQETTYVITVTNQGSAIDRDIRIVAELPSAQRFVSATGATATTSDGQRVVFAPYEALEPGEQAVWRVTTRATEPADSRMRIEMTSARLEDPVFETEATHLYK